MNHVQMTDLEKMFEERVSLADVLPYAGEVDGIFINIDGSLGKVWEIRALETEVMGDQQVEVLADSLASGLSRLSSDVCAQVILWSGAVSREVFDSYKSAALDRENDVVNAVADSKVLHLLSSEKKTKLNSGDDGLYPRRIRIFFTLRMFPRWQGLDGQARAKAFFMDPGIVEDNLKQQWQEHQQDFLRQVAAMETFFSGVGLSFEALEEEEFTRVLYNILNPGRSKEMPLADVTGGFIRDRILFNAPMAKGQGFVIDGYHTRVISLKALPPQTFAGMFGTRGRSGASLLDGIKECLFTFNITVPDQSKALERLKFQKAFAFIQRTSSLGDVSEEAVQKKEELSQIITETFKGGKSIVCARAHVTIFAPTEGEADQQADVLLGRLSRFGTEGLKEEIIAPSLFLTSLPLNFDSAHEHFVRREHRMLSDNLADMLPVYGLMQGTKTPAALYLNRCGEVVSFDPFDSSTNPHAIIIGSSGAGKSFFMNDLIYQQYRMGGYFFVLDKGHSYRKTCEALGGQYVSFDMAKPLSMNPLAKNLTTEGFAFLIEVLALMTSGGDERDRLSREEKGALQFAVLSALERVQGREALLSDVTTALKDGDLCRSRGFTPEMGRTLALRLMPFTMNGQYGGFFDRPNEFNAGGRFTVFELGDLGAYPDLQVVVLLNLMFLITGFVSSPGMTSHRKFLVIDEAWQLLKMSNTSDFIASAFKTFRKYRCSAVAVTQEAGDLLQHPSGLAILANSANKIFLRQEGAIIDRLRKELGMSTEIADILRSLRTVKGKYAESLVMTDSTAGVIRLAPDPLLYWAANSEPRNNAYLEDIRQQEGSMVKALSRCAKECPYGVR